MSDEGAHGGGRRPRVGIVGLGSMGMGMARNLLKAGFDLTGFDLDPGIRSALEEAGGRAAESLAETAQASDVLFLMVVDAEQMRSVLFEGGILDHLPMGAVVVACPTIAPTDARDIGARVEAAGFGYIDAPVSGGKVGAEAGTLSVMTSGSEAAFAATAEALEAVSERVFRLGDQPGMGATYKVVHQLAAGVHLAVAAELMALGTRAGCDPATLFEIVSGAAGNSWMFSDRVPHMLEEDFAPRSMVDIFVKDLGLVLEAGFESRTALPLTAAAHQMFLSASALGWGRADDSAVIKAYEALCGQTSGEDPGAAS